MPLCLASICLLIGVFCLLAHNITVDIVWFASTHMSLFSYCPLCFFFFLSSFVFCTSGFKYLLFLRYSFFFAACLSKVGWDALGLWILTSCWVLSVHCWIWLWIPNSIVQTLAKLWHWSDLWFSRISITCLRPWDVNSWAAQSQLGWNSTML